MTNKNTEIISIEPKILTIRGVKVMLDSDLAALYGVTTGTLNQAVKRNKDRFPTDFMFQLTPKEKQEVITNCDNLSSLKFSPSLPHVFTEHGVARWGDDYYTGYCYSSGKASPFYSLPMLNVFNKRLIMKKILLNVLLVLVVPCFTLSAQTFKADTSLVSEVSSKQKHAFYAKNPPPVLAIYQKEGKTLVLLAASHGPQSIPAVQYAFDTYHPQISLVEREPGQPFVRCTQGEDGYTAALSAKNNIPLVRADSNLEQQWKYARQNGFSYEDFQMLWMLRSAYGFAKETGKQTSAAQEIKDYKRTIHNPAWGELFTEDRLLAYFQRRYNRDFNTTDFIHLYEDLMNRYPQKWVLKTPFYKLLHITKDARSVFMAENIAAALNEYRVVFAEMGAGHFLDIHKALKKMLGKPRYITADQIPTQELWQDCTLDGLQEKVLVD